MGLYDTGIRPVIDSYLKKKSEERRDYGEFWSASQAGYCMRKVIFERKGIPPVAEDPRKIRVFESGHIFHKFIQDLTKDAGVSIVQEIELVDYDLSIMGHIDDLVSVDGNLILYDYKTAHSRSFTYSKDRDMSHYHRMQLGTYAYMLRNGKVSYGRNATSAKDLEDLRILTLSKDDLRMGEKQLTYTQQLEKEVYEYWSTLNGYWKKDVLPLCTCDRYENGFMAKPQWNPYYYQDEPCSEAWHNLKIGELNAISG